MNTFFDKYRDCDEAILGRGNNVNSVLVEHCVFGSSSIWTCRILNLCFDFLPLRPPEEKTTTNIRYSKFDSSKSKSINCRALQISMNF